jgi:hypothetical protein
MPYSIKSGQCINQGSYNSELLRVEIDGSAGVNGKDEIPWSMVEDYMKKPGVGELHFSNAIIVVQYCDRVY